MELNNYSELLKDQLCMSENFVDERRVQKIIELYRLLDEATPNGLKLNWLLNLYKGPRYEFLSESIYEVSGHKADVFREKGFAFFLECLHPEDRDLVVNAVYKDMMYYYMERPEVRATLHIEYTYRFRHADGYYMKLVECLHILEATEQGPQLILGEVMRSDEALDSPVKASYYYVDESNNRVLLASVFPASRNLAKLTDREKEVLKSIAQGKKNQEIGIDMHISVNTVRTHRNRIWKKLNIKHLHDAIKYAEGLT